MERADIGEVIDRSEELSPEEPFVDLHYYEMMFRNIAAGWFAE